MSLRTNVCPVDLRETAQVKRWKRTERRMNKAGDVKENILVRQIFGKWKAEREEDEEGENVLIQTLNHTQTRIFLGWSCHYGSHAGLVLMYRVCRQIRVSYLFVTCLIRPFRVLARVEIHDRYKVVESQSLYGPNEPRAFKFVEGFCVGFFFLT